MNQNIYFKYLLRDLWNYFPHNKSVKCLRKAYMNSKREDPTIPLTVFKEHAKNHIEAIKNKDLEYFIEKENNNELPANILPSMLRDLSEERQEQLWTYLHALLFESPTTITNLPEVPDQEQVQQMINATASMMPQIFKQLGMDVSPDDIAAASKQIQNQGLLNLFSKMMK
jgi:hypothetical protein